MRRPKSTTTSRRSTAVGAGFEPEGLAEAISGDFLVDPEFIEAPREAEQAPLVLLD